jgi:hypothetical protein
MTSVEWLHQEIIKKSVNDPSHNILSILEQAKEMYKQEIINSVLFGMQKGLNINKVPETDNDWVNNYYQETFKKD